MACGGRTCVADSPWPITSQCPDVVKPQANARENPAGRPARAGPRALGRSSVDGLRRALAADAQAICQMAADLSPDPAYLSALAAALDRYDLTNGTRYLNGVSVVNWPLHRIVFLSEMLFEAAYGGCRMGEVPIIPCGTPGGAPKSPVPC